MPQLNSTEQTKRRINKLARSLTSEEMLTQVKQKEDHIKEKKEKSEKRKHNNESSNKPNKLKVELTSENTEVIAHGDTVNSMYNCICH